MLPLIDDFRLQTKDEGMSIGGVSRLICFASPLIDSVLQLTNNETKLIDEKGSGAKALKSSVVGAVSINQFRLIVN